MHEFSVASGIVDSVLEEAEKHGAKKVTKIVLEIGQLSMISVDQLVFALEILIEGTAAEGAKIDCRVLPLKIECDKKHASEITPEKKDMYSLTHRLKCPVCGEPAKPIGGRECMIKEITAE
jgi:hydrogenase nickel incorporation protein HypA/HybF